MALSVLVEQTIAGEGKAVVMEYSWIINIAHFRAKLTAEQDEKTRQTLLRLLAQEEAKLANLEIPLRQSEFTAR